MTKNGTMTNSTKLTADTITNKQIRALRDEAGEHGDPISEDSDGTGTTLGRPCTVEQAKANLADVINNGQG